MKIIYISGKISGIENEAPLLFEKAENELKLNGFNTVNPMTLNHDHDLSWENYMRVDLIALLRCTHIYMLKNWQESVGANIEYRLAVDLKLTIIFE